MVTAEVTERQAHRQRDKALQLGRELDERLYGKPAMALVGRLLAGKRNPGPNALRRSRTLSAGSQRRASRAPQAKDRRLIFSTPKRSTAPRERAHKARYREVRPDRRIDR